MSALKRRPLKLPAGRAIRDPARAVAAVTAAVPELGPLGMLMEQEKSSFCLECIATAMTLLAQCRRVKTPRLSSYWLKHVAGSAFRRRGMVPRRMSQSRSRPRMRNGSIQSGRNNNNNNDGGGDEHGRSHAADLPGTAGDECDDCFRYGRTNDGGEIHRRTPGFCTVCGADE